jgi:hypothetical protein
MKRARIYLILIYLIGLVLQFIREEYDIMWMWSIAFVIPFIATFFVKKK